MSKKSSADSFGAVTVSKKYSLRKMSDDSVRFSVTLERDDYDFLRKQCKIYKIPEYIRNLVESDIRAIKRGFEIQKTLDSKNAIDLGDIEYKERKLRKSDIDKMNDSLLNLRSNNDIFSFDSNEDLPDEF